MALLAAILSLVSCEAGVDVANCRPGSGAVVHSPDEASSIRTAGDKYVCARFGGWLGPSGASQFESNFRGVDLSGANLAKADFSGIVLAGANLSGADLSGAILEDTDLSRANLQGANLSGAIGGDDTPGRVNLAYADLSDANLSNADLSADLTSADLTGATLDNAHLGLGAGLTLDMLGSAASTANLQIEIDSEEVASICRGTALYGAASYEGSGIHPLLVIGPGGSLNIKGWDWGAEHLTLRRWNDELPESWRLEGLSIGDDIPWRELQRLELVACVKTTESRSEDCDYALNPTTKEPDVELVIWQQRVEMSVVEAATGRVVATEAFEAEHVDCPPTAPLVFAPDWHAEVNRSVIFEWLAQFADTG